VSRESSPSVDNSFKCPYCPCMFFCQSDLDVHLKAFGDASHLRLWRCVHVLLEVDGNEAGVDSHGDWSRRSKRDKRFSPNAVLACRDFVRVCMHAHHSV